MPVQQWREDNNYKIVEEVVTKLFIVNDPAELIVKRDGDRIGTVRSKKAFHWRMGQHTDNLQSGSIELIHHRSLVRQSGF